jgi:plasmid stabilization system protein ParE
VARIVVSQRARTDLAGLIETHDLPADTVPRVQAVIEPLARFPQMGRRLVGRWRGCRVILGPWPRMLIVYEYDEATDTVGVAAIHDARSTPSSATSEG